MQLASEQQMTFTCAISNRAVRIYMRGERHTLVNRGVPGEGRTHALLNKRVAKTGSPRPLTVMMMKKKKK